MDEIPKRIKRCGGKSLAPGDYPYDQQRLGGKTTKQFKWDTEKRETFLETISKIEKGKKGPADYNTLRKSKVHGTYTFNTEKGQFMNEVSFMSNQTPAPATYKPNNNADSKMERSPNANLNRCKSERPACLSFSKEREASPSPHTYEVEKKWKVQSQIQPIAVNFLFKKEKNKTYTELIAQKKSYSPGVAKYDLSTKRMDFISKGP